jgi:anti-sigma factor RsiW
MSRFPQEAHPDQSDLLRWIDGELASRDARDVERHVEACWDCRAQVEELKLTVAECVRYRKEFLSEAMPEPPQPWANIYTAFARADAQDTPQRTGLLQYIRGTGSSLRWTVGVTTAALAVAGALYFGGTPSKKALPPVNSVQEPQILRNGAESGAASQEVPPRLAVPSRPAAIVPGTPASISDELQVMKALHGIGADLGDPLHVSLTKDRVLVAGVGITPDRQRQIEAALHELPRVSVEFSNPAAQLPDSGTDSAPTVTPNSASNSANPFQAKLEAQLGSRMLADKLVGQVLNWNETLMSHAYALHSLAQKFPDEVAMGDADRAALHSLIRDHLTAMSAPAGNFDRELVPVLTGLGATAASPAMPVNSSWQPASEHVFQTARSVEMLSSKLLGVARGEKANFDLPSELLGAVNELRSGIEQNLRLVGR